MSMYEKAAEGAFEARDRITAAAHKIASEELAEHIGPGTYLDVEDIHLDADPDHPTVVIHAAIKWQGNQQDFHLTMPLADFAEVMYKC